MARAVLRAETEMCLRIKNIPMQDNFHEELLADAQHEIGDVRGIRLIWDADQNQENGSAVAYIYFWNEYPNVKYAALRYDGFQYDQRILEAQIQITPRQIFREVVRPNGVAMIVERRRGHQNVQRDFHFLIQQQEPENPAQHQPVPENPAQQQPVPENPAQQLLQRPDARQESSEGKYWDQDIIIGPDSEDESEPTTRNARFTSQSLADEIGLPHLARAISAAQSQARRTSFISSLTNRVMGRKF